MERYLIAYKCCASFVVVTFLSNTNAGQQCLPVKEIIAKFFLLLLKLSFRTSIQPMYRSPD